MAMTGGIGYEIDQLAELGVPELMRRQSVDPQLKYALALQEATKMVEAAARERDMSQQMPMPADVVGQMETSLAERLAPGVQQQGQRSMQMQNRPAMGLPGQAAPNLARMAQGGIVGYAEGDMVEIGAKSKGPIPRMSPEENAMVLQYLEGLKKFDYYDKNPDKVSPEGRQALEQDRRTFEAQFPNSFRQKVNEMMYGPDKGMAMGGEVKRYQTGDLVEEDEPFLDLGALFELIGRGRDALFSPSRATQEAREIRRGEVEQASERGVNLLNVLPPSQGLTPEQLASFDKVDVTGAVPTGIVEERRARVESGEAARNYAQQAARRAEANAARREATPTMPQNEGVTADMYMMPKEELTMAQKLMQLPKVAREAKPAPSKTGIAGLLQKAKPFADKAADIAEILGRGAGASKGFEFAKIAEESRKINQAEQARQDEIAQASADRKMRQDLLREEYGFRDKELRSKLLVESSASEREADSDLLETIIENIDNDPELLQAAEEFKDTYGGFFGGYDKKKYIEAFTKKREELIDKRFNDAKARLASVLGGSNASSAMDDLAKYGN